MKKLSFVLVSSLFALFLLLPTQLVATSPFVDISEDYTHYEGIMALYNEGVISGYPTPEGNRSFRPAEPVSREHTAVIFTALLNLNQSTDGVDYRDIPVDYLYHDAIAEVTAANIFSGSGGQFLPKNKLTRAQMATVIVRAYNLKETNATVTMFLDNVPDSHKQNVYILAQHGLTRQYSDFRPTEPVTRGQFASFLKRTSQMNGSPLTTERKVLKLVNDIRAEEGLAPVVLDHSLNQVARLKSEDMYTNAYFDHVSPTYGTPFDMLRKFGIRFQAAAENIAYGYPTPAEVVQGWKNSEGHYLNIIGDYTHMGIGVSEQGNYWTQLFISR